MTSFEFSIARFHGWAPGIADAAAWRRWIDGELVPASDVAPDLSHLKPIQRRRLSALARAAYHTATRCLADETPSDAVFCSAHGDTARTLELLESIARNEDLSPNAFSLSVHNSVSGLFSIFERCRAPSVTLAAGAEGVGCAFLEAATLLNVRPDARVLVVLYDADMPELFARYVNPPPAAVAAAFLVTADTSAPRVTVQRRTTPGAVQAHWDQIRRLVDFFNTGQESLTLQSSRSQWQWNRA